MSMSGRTESAAYFCAGALVAAGGASFFSQPAMNASELQTTTALMHVLIDDPPRFFFGFVTKNVEKC